MWRCVLWADVSFSCCSGDVTTKGLLTLLLFASNPVKYKSPHESASEAVSLLANTLRAALLTGSRKYLRDYELATPGNLSLQQFCASDLATAISVPMAKLLVHVFADQFEVREVLQVLCFIPRVAD